MQRQKRVVRDYANPSSSERVYKAISKVRLWYAEKKGEQSEKVPIFDGLAVAGIVTKAEEVVNSYKDQPTVLAQFLQTGWLKYSPTSNHYYIQLA